MDEAATASPPSTLATLPVEIVHAVQTSEHDADTSTSKNKADLNGPPSESTAWSQTVQSILRFLEQADNGVLLKILGALAILTYLILGRLGLLFIGLVAGFVVHDYCGGLVADTDVAAGNLDGKNGGIAIFSSRKRRELGIEVAARLLEWKPSQSVQDADQTENVSENVSQDTNSLDLSRIPPATADALTHLIDAIIDNYVLYWYKPILPTENSFAASCRKIVVGFVNSLSAHMTRKRSAETFLQFVTNASSMIIVFLSELSLALQETPTDSSSTEEHVRQYLIKYPDSSLANVLSIEQQQKKLRMVADDVLLNFLEPSAFNCEALRTFFREILAGVVLESIVKSCSQPDFINGWIVYLLKEGEPQIMNAIDAGLESASKGDIAGLSGLAGDRSQDSARRTSRSEENRTVDSGLKNVASHEPHNDDQSSLMSSGERETDSSKSSIREIPDASSVKSISSINSPESPQQFVAGSQQRSPNEVSKFASREEVEAAGQILYGASVVVDDGSLPSDKTTMKAKPNTEYMLQIEPASTRYPGWMIFRKYQDFEHLHEGLATLSRLHRVPFLSIHPVLPTYRDQTKAALAKSLERYLRDALEYKDFAKSERLRKFLDKDNGLIETTTAQARPGFNIRASSTFENMGKNVLGVLSNAPKGVAGGGKAVLDGVTGVFTGSNRSRNSVDNASRGFVNLPMSVSNDAPIAARQRTSDPAFGNATPETSRRLSIEQNINSAVDRDSEVSTTAISIKDSPVKQVGEKTTAQDLVDRPMSPASSVSSSLSKTSIDNDGSKLDTVDGALPVQLGDDAADRQVTEGTKSVPAKASSQPINEDETRMAVELIFAVINELYALSSAWNIRKTLLNAAKTYILRPRNPHLEAIRVLVQDSMIDANTTDEAIAANIRKIRENSLPTEAEMKAWPPPLSREESERLKNEARRLLIERGMPQVLTSVMGAAASGEALGKVFDCLQVDEVGRGFMFALILQALRAVIL